MSNFSSIMQLSPSGPFTSSTTLDVELGQVGVTLDGRRFSYAQAGAVALVPGTLVQSQAESTANWENLAPSAAAIGATSITITTSTTNALNVFAGGYMMVTVTPGQGYQYRIKSNTASSAGSMTLVLEDSLLVALTTSSRLDLVPNVYTSNIINPTTATGSITGVAVFAVPATNYGWIQINGMANVLAQGTVVVGTQVAASSTTAGAVVATSGVLASVGFAVTGIASTEYGTVNLNINS